MTELCKGIRHSFFKKGDKICAAGDKDHRLYIILRGKVLLTISDNMIKSYCGQLADKKSV